MWQTLKLASSKMLPSQYYTIFAQINIDKETNRYSLRNCLTRFFFFCIKCQITFNPYLYKFVLTWSLRYNAQSWPYWYVLSMSSSSPILSWARLLNPHIFQLVSRRLTFLDRPDEGRITIRYICIIFRTLPPNIKIAHKILKGKGRFV